MSLVPSGFGRRIGRFFVGRFFVGSLLARRTPSARIAAGAALLLAAVGAHAGNVVDIDVIHRATGQVAQTWRHDGRTFVAGAPGDRYAIRISNRTGGRVLAVVSVDGVNIVTGDTASPAQSGYVLGPWQSYDIAGWRKSSSEIAAFYFTRLGDSYAARTDRPANVGVIGIAAFREWQRPRPLPQPIAPREGFHDRGAAAEPFTQPKADARESEGAPAAPAASSTAPTEMDASAAGGAAANEAARGASNEAARGAANEAARGASNEAARSADASGRLAPRRERIGTGHGERERSDVVTVEFRRASSAPNEVLSIHYDSHANLVARGVIPGAPRLAEPQPFPGMRYVPDPRS